MYNIPASYDTKADVFWWEQCIKSSREQSWCPHEFTPEWSQKHNITSLHQPGLWTLTVAYRTLQYSSTQKGNS